MLKRSVGFIEHPAADSAAVVQSGVSSLATVSAGTGSEQKKSWGIGARHRDQLGAQTKEVLSSSGNIHPVQYVKECCLLS